MLSPGKILPYAFKPHTDNCGICFKSSYSSKKVGSFWKKIEEHLLHLSFIKMRNLDANVKVLFKPFYVNNAVTIAKTVEIDENFVCRIFVYGNEIDKNIPALAEIPFVRTNENYKTFCNKLNELNICTGNTDFQDVIDKRVNFPEPFPSAVTFVESSQGHSKLVPEEFNIIRSINCKYLVDGENLCIESKSDVQSKKM